MEQNKEYAIARQAMINSQIHPMGVVSESLLAAFDTVPREEFVPNDKRGICHCDEDVEIMPGRYLMEPSVFARMVQACKPTADDVALSLGSGVGYNAAILSQLVSTVVALEEDQSLIKQAQASWDKFMYCNIVAVTGELALGAPKNAPYDLIIINGAVAEIPEGIKAQLSVGGRLVALVKKAGQSVAKATLIEQTHDDVFEEQILFDAGTPYLKGFEPKKEFIF
jgi:protein-L-isoaspartate(D-aspartate) O-methyltransferase